MSRTRSGLLKDGADILGMLKYENSKTAPGLEVQDICYELRWHTLGNYAGDYYSITFAGRLSVNSGGGCISRARLGKIFSVAVSVSWFFENLRNILTDSKNELNMLLEILAKREVLRMCQNRLGDQQIFLPDSIK